MALPQVPQATRADQAVVVLRNAILNGDLPPGTPLREIQLAGELSVGRGPLREALLRLEEEGLVRREPFRGSVVAEIGAERITEIEQLRTILEPHAALTALPRLRNGPSHERLLAAVEALEEAAEQGDERRCIDTHLDVHRAIYEAAQNRVLLDIWSSWQNQMRLFLSLEHRRFGDLFGDLRVVAASHRHLLEVIESGDKRLIRREFAEHIRPETVSEDFEMLRAGSPDAG
jgi:DNA-binding GntR family transcriptional regulator